MFLKSVSECAIPDLDDAFFAESFEDQFFLEDENFIVKAVKSFFSMLANAVRAIINWLTNLVRKKPIPDAEKEATKAEEEAKKGGSTSSDSSKSDEEKATEEKKKARADRAASNSSGFIDRKHAEQLTARTNKEYKNLPHATREDTFADLQKKAETAGLEGEAKRMGDFIERLTTEVNLDAKDPLDAVNAFNSMVGDLTRTDDNEKIKQVVEKGMDVLDKFVVDKVVRKTSDATIKGLTVAKLQKVVDYHVKNVAEITKAADTFLAAVKSNESLFSGKVAKLENASKMLEGYRLLSKKTYQGIKQAVTIVTKRHSMLVGIITPLTRTIAAITSKLSPKTESNDDVMGLIMLEADDFSLFIC